MTPPLAPAALDTLPSITPPPHHPASRHARAVARGSAAAEAAAVASGCSGRRLGALPSPMLSDGVAAAARASCILPAAHTHARALFVSAAASQQTRAAGWSTSEVSATRRGDSSKEATREPPSTSDARRSVAFPLWRGLEVRRLGIAERRQLASKCLGIAELAAAAKHPWDASEADVAMVDCWTALLMQRRERRR